MMTVKEESDNSGVVAMTMAVKEVVPLAVDDNENDDNDDDDDDDGDDVCCGCSVDVVVLVTVCGPSR
jgi:hypothetical protein